MDLTEVDPARLEPHLQLIPEPIDLDELEKTMKKCGWSTIPRTLESGKQDISETPDPRLWIVVKGRLQVDVYGRTYVLSAGDALTVPGELEYCINNSEDASAVYLSCKPPLI